MASTLIEHALHPQGRVAGIVAERSWHGARLFFFIPVSLCLSCESANMKKLALIMVALIQHFFQGRSLLQIRAIGGHENQHLRNCVYIPITYMCVYIMDVHSWVLLYRHVHRHAGRHAEQVFRTGA